ncbi:hypothetical protein ASG35_22505 [Burkholderia sp. Leaf177]|uniref:DUF3597 domain-containing protein n=1 Tax=Burkholderia sp. Leaf177 TaxID=1736287 RepID=UPI0006FE8585|nr:DUF3597 domain-containing protein [Burkholderia sp. Leaf177]KQR73744.1 hypothetical protein ASG35_22505 [Burkholderia sp. Leaf177]
MSIFTNILNKIFPQDHPANTASTGATAPSAPPSPNADSSNGSTVAASNVQPPVAALPPVDVEAALIERQAGINTQLNWRSSIVDLLKLLDLDSGLDARTELAAELNYPGSTEDSAAMNIWLHKRVMEKLAENGGQVPADLKN